jgi:hypothetical protein
MPPARNTPIVAESAKPVKALKRFRLLAGHLAFDDGIPLRVAESAKPVKALKPDLLVPVVRRDEKHRSQRAQSL